MRFNALVSLRPRRAAPQSVPTLSAQMPWLRSRGVLCSTHFVCEGRFAGSHLRLLSVCFRSFLLSVLCMHLPHHSTPYTQHTPPRKPRTPRTPPRHSHLTVHAVHLTHTALTTHSPYLTQPLPPLALHTHTTFTPHHIHSSHTTSHLSHTALTTHLPYLT